jgi:hypothetical protein
MGKSDFGGLLETHPAIGKLASPVSTRDNVGAVALTGFVGKSADAARVRLHRSLAYPTHWIEINRADILHVALADQDLQRVTVWVQNDAAIVRSTLSLRDVVGGADMLQVDRGRVRMMIRSGIAAALSGPVGPTGSCGCRSWCCS